jgi:uncharacterized delta-60 repeat protein
MGVIRDNRTKIVAGGLISASYVSDVYNVLTGNTVENIAFSGSVNITGSLIADLTGTASFANTASYSIVTTNVVTSSSFADTASFALNVTAPQYLYINPASGSVTVDFASASMIELNVTDDLTLTLTGSETARDYKLLLRNASTASKSLTWTNTDIYYNSNNLSSTVTAGDAVIVDTNWPLANGGSTIINNVVYDFKKLASGKYIAIGAFTSVSGSFLNRIVRFNSDFTVDDTFNIGTGFNNNLWRIVEQTDGKLVAIGQFTQYSGSACNYITRINTDGTRDLTFNIGTGFNSGFFSTTKNALEIQSDGKILVGGGFTSYSGSATNRIARINTDGTLDAIFTSGIGTGFSSYECTDIKLQSDGKIIAVSAGAFDGGSGGMAPKVVRINTDGTWDNTFNPGTIASFNINYGSVLYVQDDDKVIVSTPGVSSVSGSSVATFYRLNSNGSLDNTFNNTDTNNWSQYSSTIPTYITINDGKILVTSENSNYFYRILDASGNLLSAVSITNQISGNYIYTLFVSGSDIITAGNNNIFNPYGSSVVSKYLTKLTANPNPLKYNNYNIYSNGSRYFVDTLGYNYIYETDPNIP